DIRLREARQLAGAGRSRWRNAALRHASSTCPRDAVQHRVSWHSRVVIASDNSSGEERTVRDAFRQLEGANSSGNMARHALAVPDRLNRLLIEIARRRHQRRDERRAQPTFPGAAAHAIAEGLELRRER